MKVIIKKAIKHDFSPNKVWPVNQVLVVTEEKGADWIQKGYAEEYKGVFPPKKEQKVKMNLSQLKT